jgi:hypothetical protein
MDPKTLRRLIAGGFLAVSIAACGGGTAATDDDSVTTADTAPAATAVSDGVADPNDPAAVGAVIYDEAVPVPGTTLGACDIVTAADIKAAFGLDVTVPAGSFEADPTTLSPGHSECRYEGDYGRVIVDLTPEDGANLYDAAYGAYDGLEFIDGVGDGAFWAPKTNRGFVWQDKVTVMLSVYPAQMGTADADLIKTLGEAVIGKL